MSKPENHILVIFGASGDLTKRKLIPALYALEIQDLLSEKFAIIGVSRTTLNDENFRETMQAGLQKFSGEKGKDSEQMDRFLQKIFYTSVDADDHTSYMKLSAKIDELQAGMGIDKKVIYYLSVPPSLYGVIPGNLALNGLNDQSDGWKRVIIEKPFGYNLESAVRLNADLEKDWSEDQLYRIDHYLGKETVQNLLVTRFTNGIFEPLWNRNYVDHIEITSAENIGVEKRGGYYEGSGALRDMVQNHLLQVAALIAMEPPSSMQPDAIRNETVKVFQSIRSYQPEDIKKSAIRGQYLAATINGSEVKGYRDEEGVEKDSKTETFAAIKFYIDNWRWGGIPFYVRTGKYLPTRVSEAVIHFKPTPHHLFSRWSEPGSTNQLVIRIQPDEGVLLKFGMKTPGAGFNVQNVNMDFHYSDLSHQRIPEAYERLLLDCMTGDSTLYARIDGVMATWKFLDSILDAWKNDNSIPLFGYPAGTWGPESADSLFENGKSKWRYPCKNLSNDGLYCEL